MPLEYSAAIPEMDFETYSEAGYYFDVAANRWCSITATPPHGLPAVGTAVYSEHPSTEVLCMAYDLHYGAGAKLWVPGSPPPEDLFSHISAGGLVEAWNSYFEFSIWKNVCSARMGWPSLPLPQLRDAMAKSRAHALPGGLGAAANAIDAPVRKIADGSRLLKKFSVPHTPTKKDPRKRILLSEDPEDARRLYAYCLTDIKAEASVSALTPDLSATESEVWLMDQRINDRGIGLDLGGLADCKEIIRQASEQGIIDIQQLTGGAVTKPTEIKRIRDWIQARGVYSASLDADAVAELLHADIPPDVRRVLEVRASLGSASVKKLGAMSRRVSRDGRLRDLFVYCGAQRTGRWAGAGVQPQNLTSGGPPVSFCDCGHYHAADFETCPWCGRSGTSAPAEWGIGAAEDALYVIKSGSALCVAYYFGDPVAAVSGCMRALLCAGPGNELISSDYSAIEAVCLAALAGEDWRLDVFRGHGKIYEMSASKITGIPFEDFERHKAETGEHHPMRKKIGKVAELASGYQGAVGAWKAFGAEKHFGNDDEILAAVRQWRADSPAIVNFWYRLEDAARAAVQNRGQSFQYRDIVYCVYRDVLYCRLPSGRLLSYHRPRLVPDVTPWGKPVDKITFMGWNSDYTKGSKGWMRFDTYGGKLAENVTQATARDLLAHGMLNLENAGYPIVMHVHDEPVSEVKLGYGSVEEYENLMCRLPAWAAEYPLRAGGGWRGQRYRKD